MKENKKLRFLVADDEKELLSVYKTLLGSHFECEVDIAENGEEAFELASSNKYSLIISDHKMDVMKGSKFIQWLRATEGHNKDTYVLLISGFVEEIELDSESESRVSKMRKPFDPGTLIGEMQKILKLSGEF